MPSRRPAPPWATLTYNGFAGGRPPASNVEGHAPPDPARPEAGSRGWIVGGVVAALAAGGLFGALARPDLAGAPRPAEKVAAAPRPGVPIEAAPLSPPAPPPSAEPLEVLPPQPPVTVEAEPVPAAPAPAAPERLTRPQLAQAEPPTAPRLAPAEPPTTPRLARAEPPPAPSPERAYAPRPARARFEGPCEGTLAQQMVCATPDLARLDIRMHQAYQRALASGVPSDDLREDQEDWLRIREEAARLSRQAVAGIYRQRIRELNDLADGPYD